MSNVYHNVRGDLLGSFNDRDVHYEHTREVEASKISKENAATIALNALQLTLWSH